MSLPADQANKVRNFKLQLEAASENRVLDYGRMRDPVYLESHFELLNSYCSDRGGRSGISICFVHVLGSPSASPWTTVNAQAWRPSTGVYGITFQADIDSRLGRLFETVVACTEVLSDITPYDPSDVQWRPSGDERNALIHDILFGSLQSRHRDLLRPGCARSTLVDALRELVCEFIFLHELSHILQGHLDAPFLTGGSGLAEELWHGRGLSENEQISQLCEIDADDHALFWSLSHFIARTSPLKSYYRCAGELGYLFRILPIGLTLLHHYFAAAVRREISTWAIPESQQYPTPAERLNLSWLALRSFGREVTHEDQWDAVYEAIAAGMNDGAAVVYELLAPVVPELFEGSVGPTINLDTVGFNERNHQLREFRATLEDYRITAR